MNRIKCVSHEAIKCRVLIFFILAGLLVALSIVAPSLAPNDPYKTNSEFMKVAPNSQFPFGTDRYGRCVLSRVLMGARMSVLSSLALVAVSFIVGTTLGTLCGYYGGVLDEIVMRIADVLLAFPQMVLAIAVAGILGGGLFNAMLALGITSWTLYARLSRSLVMEMKEEPFIAAARFSGCGSVSIMFRHILPNVVGPLLVNAATQIGTMMIGVAGLSFLGIGVTPPSAEWGSMINEARTYVRLAPWTVLAPSGAMVFTVMVFNYLGDSVRDMMDVSKL